MSKLSYYVGNLPSEGHKKAKKREIANKMVEPKSHHEKANDSYWNRQAKRKGYGSGADYQKHLSDLNKSENSRA